jgi:hypothetical protein
MFMERLACVVASMQRSGIEVIENYTIYDQQKNVPTVIGNL